MSKDFTHIYNSPVGKLTLASDGENLVGLWFDGDRHFCKDLNAEHEENGSLPIFKQADLWLDIYFSGREPDLTPPLSIRGSEFRKQVLWILLKITYGKREHTFYPLQRFKLISNFYCHRTELFPDI